MIASGQYKRKQTYINGSASPWFYFYFPLVIVHSSVTKKCRGVTDVQCNIRLLFSTTSAVSAKSNMPVEHLDKGSVVLTSKTV